MPAKVFICYRRDDSAGHAGRVHDRLEREFGRDLLFMDVDAVPLGVDFVDVLAAEVAKCDVLLAIIGPNWLDSKDIDGTRRLDSVHDFVRIEISEALKRGIPVIPLLLEGTRIPRAEALPDGLKDLVRRNGIEVRHASFNTDIDRLIRGLRANASSQETTQPVPEPGPPVYAAVAAVDVEAAPSPLIAAALAASAEVLHEDSRVRVEAPIVHGAPDGWLTPGHGRSEWFQDHVLSPEMVLVPAGAFEMGLEAVEMAAMQREHPKDWWEFQAPMRKVAIEKLFAVSRFAITFAEWDAAIAEGGCRRYRPGDQGWGRDRLPVINVSYEDARAYAAWLTQKTGKRYRLLSEAEHEFVTRAGTTAPYWWGAAISTRQANFDGSHANGDPIAGECRQRTLPVDSFEPNPWGLYQVHGNVWEWCDDHWHASYEEAPSDGRAWVTGGDQSRRVVRGGSWSNNPRSLRASARMGLASGLGVNNLGFRLARDL